MKLGTSHGHQHWLMKSQLHKSVQVAMKQKVNTASSLYSNKQVHDHIGNAIRACVANNTWAAPNVSQCSTTAFTLFQIQLDEILENITNTTEDSPGPPGSGVNTTEPFNNPLGMLTYVTTEIIDTINTTIPILPNDIPVIVNVLETILKYVCIYTYVCINFS